MYRLFIGIFIALLAFLYWRRAELVRQAKARKYKNFDHTPHWQRARKANGMNSRSYSKRQSPKPSATPNPLARYYKVLGLPPTANPAQVKKAYHKLAKLYHPDARAAEGKPPADEKMKQINEAYEKLQSDSPKKDAQKK